MLSHQIKDIHSLECLGFLILFVSLSVLFNNTLADFILEILCLPGSFKPAMSDCHSISQEIQRIFYDIKVHVDHFHDLLHDRMAINHHHFFISKESHIDSLCKCLL